ncbi:MAG: acetolactate synthase small subunit [Eubacteriales bacterium]|jgi:acetolactate synthase-1/3 small subunit|nr:acetolactate synthase small subunit [Clostridiales bacterium]
MKRTILVKVQNHSGMLSKVSGLFSRRAFNIHSLAVGVTEDPEISCMTIVVDGDNDMVEQVEKQLAKLIGVLRVKTLEPGEFISKELVFIKVPADARTRSEIVDIVKIFGARIVEVSQNSLILEYADTTEKIAELEYMLSPYGHCEIVRTGAIAIEKDVRPNGTL